MKKRSVAMLSLVALVATVGSSAVAESPTMVADGLRAKYSASQFVVGIGEAPKEGQNGVKARRSAEVLARSEVAKQIKVHVRENTIDLMCEGKGSALLKGTDCKNMVVSVVELSVDMFLSGVRIAETAEGPDSWFAVALLEKKKAADSLAEESKEATERAIEEVAKAKAGDADAKEKAVAELRKAVILDKERAVFDQIKSDSDSIFEDLERNITALGPK